MMMIYDGQVVVMVVMTHLLAKLNIYNGLSQQKTPETVFSTE